MSAPWKGLRVREARPGAAPVVVVPFPPAVREGGQVTASGQRLCSCPLGFTRGNVSRCSRTSPGPLSGRMFPETECGLALPWEQSAGTHVVPV